MLGLLARISSLHQLTVLHYQKISFLFLSKHLGNQQILKAKSKESFEMLFSEFLVHQQTLGQTQLKLYLCYDLVNMFKTERGYGGC